MTYLPARVWWLKPFHLFARCQDKCLAEQWDNGVRYFDLRVRFDEWTQHKRLVFAHGLMPYTADVDLADVLTALDAWAAASPKEIAAFRVVYENTADMELTSEPVWFHTQLKQLLKKCLHLKFCGAYVKHPWKEIEPPAYKVRYVDCYGKKFPWIPRLWAWRQRKETFSAIQRDGDDNNTVVMTDFV